jgi:type IV pilus assembly protein PilV
MNRRLRPPAHRQRGIALLEALIAVVILALGLLGTIALQARSYSALADSGMRAEATIAADRLIGILSNDTANLASYQVASGGPVPASLLPWATETSAAIPNAVYVIAVVPEAQRTRVEIAISWQRKRNGATNQHTVTAYIR